MSTNFKIRNFIRAKSEKRLRSLMFKKQTELGMASLSFDIVFAKGFWYAWYYEVLKTDNLEEVVDDTTENN